MSIMLLAILSLVNLLVSAHPKANSTKGTLYCRKQGNTWPKEREFIDSELIYWKTVGGDIDYESPITPHHDEHHEKFLTFEYDHGGWNNMRMGFESLIIAAHAMGRTLVMPPHQDIYLLTARFKDEGDKDEKDEMGFLDFYDFKVLQSQKGFHMIKMSKFLRREGLAGKLKGIIPPDKDTQLWGGRLWDYLKRVADVTPKWFDKVLAFPEHPGDFELKQLSGPEFTSRLAQFRLQYDHNQIRDVVYYDKELQNARHIHIRGDGDHRILQHTYAFNFFANKSMASFYKRFNRDFIRYKDRIHCIAHWLVAELRRESLAIHPERGGSFYALHIRRGDLQFKEVKIGAPEMLRNLVWENGSAIIPPGSFVYIATDDPDGKCDGCTDAQGRECKNLRPPLPTGCMEDTSWDAFRAAGWNVRFLRDLSGKGLLKGVNPNFFGVLETIICSRAMIFAGTYQSTFTGYIHRLRGYHGLGEMSFYHSTGRVMDLRMERSVGSGWPREWRTGWTDDDRGELI